MRIIQFQSEPVATSLFPVLGGPGINADVGVEIGWVRVGTGVVVGTGVTTVVDVGVGVFVVGTGVGVAGHLTIAIAGLLGSTLLKTATLK